MWNSESLIRKVRAFFTGLVTPRFIRHVLIPVRLALTAFILIILPSTGRSQYASVAVTGFTADVIANGASFTGSVSADVDGGGYYFLNQSFTAFGTPTFFLPNSGLINSAATSGLSFQLADAAANNSLRLVAQNSSGTLSFVTPRSAGILYLLATSGSGTSTINATVNFTDASTQTFTGLNIADWYNGAGFAIQGIGRTNATALDNGGGTSNPRLYQLSLAISGANYTKQIASVTITKTSTAGFTQVMAVSVATACTVPAAQATSLVLTAASTSVINGSFTAAAPPADGYLVVRYPAGATAVAPVNGTNYVAGSLLGTGTIVQAGAATTFSAAGLTGGTLYDFYLYAYNNTGCTGPVYNVTAPLSGSQATNACSGLSGVIPVGPTGTYTTLTAALAALSTGISGAVVLELQSNYTSAGETFPILIGANACFSATNTLTIRPAPGANGLVITGSNAGPTIDFNGVSYVTIDGRPGGTGSSIAVTPAGSTNAINLNIINTNAAGTAIRIDNGSSLNSIRYCDLQGQNTTGANVPTTLAGVVYFGNTGAYGNDNNTIDHCNIHSTGTGTAVPSIGIYALGATNSGLNINFNDSDTISACHIYDYFLPGGNSAGVELNQGVNGWVVKDNSFFQTATCTYTAAGYNRGIWIIPNRTSGTSVGNGFVVTGNYIGGSAPLCSGTPYTLTAQANYFDGIRLEVADGAVSNPSSVQGNTITNISQTTTITTANDPFHGIAISGSNGSVNIGTITGNTIGSATTAGAITVAAGSGSHTIGIFFANTPSTSNPTFNLSNNTIGGITIPNAGSNFSGIFDNTYGTLNANNNTIGGTISNSIYASNTSTTSSFVKGFNIASGFGTYSITNNIITNLSNASLATGTTVCQVVGIAISGTAASTTIIVPVIAGNRVTNLYNASAVTGSGASAAVIGVSMNSTNATVCSLRGNVIDSLVVNGNAAVNVTGIYFNGSGTVSHFVVKNFVHSLDATGGNTGAVISGLVLNAGTATVANNMIRLGIRPDGTPVTTALTINGIMSAATLANNFYYNSVYVGGAGVGTTAINTYAFRRTAASGTYDIRDNIFVNNRSNATTGGKHYSIYFTTSNTGAATNYNVYQYNGTGGVFGFTGAADILNYNNGGVATPGWISSDLNSIAGEPNFINATGAIADVNLHINTSGTTVTEGTGISIAGISDDYDGQDRSLLTPADIGADAGNFTLPPACVAPASPTALVLTTVSSSEISGSFTAPAGGANGYIIVRYFAGATPAAPVDGVTYGIGSTLGTGTVIAVGTATSFTNPGLVANTTYDYYVYAYNNNCFGPVRYSVSLNGSQTTAACTGLSGVLTVGPTATYPTLTAALAALSGGISGSVIVELQSDYTSAGETFPIIIGYTPCFSPSNRVTIRPAVGANGLVITGSNAGPTIDFAGGNYITIDGRPGGIGSAIAVTAAGALNPVNLNIINTNVAGAAIRMDNGASNNVVKYCDLQGQNTAGANVPTTLAGVVYFGSNGASGNDNNLIDRCNIHSTGAGTSIPSIGVYAIGPNNAGLNANFNDNDTISNCNIYDYFLAGGSSAGVELNQGVNAWTISGNSFFQTATRSYTAGGFNRAIWAIPNRTSGSSAGNGFVITNNYIGGTAPLCAGTAYTLTAQANYFDAIRLEVADGITVNPSSVQGNTITNIAITSTITTANDVFHGIAVASSNGSVNIGTVAGNTIGAATGNDAILISAGSGSHTIPLYISNSAGATSVINVRNNIAGGITLPNAGSNFSGIFDNQAGTVNIDNNLIGSLATTNSINASSTAATAQFVRGINVPAGAGIFTITNNTIANLNNNTISTGSNSQAAGIDILSGTATVPAITGNLVRNLSCAAQNTGGGTGAALLGIGMAATTSTASNVSGNTIYSLSTGATSAGVYMEGIFFWGSTSAAVTNTISRNFVHSFDIVNAGNTGVNIRGIEINQGQANVLNNMVRLGIRSDGTDLTNAVRIDGFMKGSGLTSNFYYNSVYIGGAGVGTAANITSAFRKETANGVDDIQNNIFVNNRSNNSTGGTHYAICTNAATNLTFNYNLYRYAGTGGAFASTSGLVVVPTNAAYAAGWMSSDVNSLVADPQFISAGGPAITADLHISTSVFSPANGVATPLALVPGDYDGDTRNATTPDIGADEFTQINGIDMQALSLVSPIVNNGCYGATEAVVVRIRNNSSVAIDYAINPVTVTVDVTGAATATLSAVVSSGTLAAGATQDIAMTTPATIDMSAAGVYTFTATTSVVGDINTTNNTMAPTTRTRVALVAGTIAVSPTSYCINGGTPTLTVTGANGHSGIQWQQSTTSGSGFNNISGATTSPYTVTPAITQTMYYRLVAGCGAATATSSEVQVILYRPQVTGTTPATRCDAGTLTLQAAGSAGTILNWYAAAFGGSPLGTGTSFVTPSINTTTTYYVAAIQNGCESAPRIAVVATVNQSVNITAQPVSQAVCAGSPVTFSVTATGTSVIYQWRKGGVNIPGATSSTYTIPGAALADAGSYDVVVSNMCGTATSSSVTLTVGSVNTWIGATSTDWNTSSNWCGGIPSPSSDITILAGTPFSPILTTNGYVRNLTISNGAVVTVATGGTLNIYGNYVNNGTFTATAGTVAFAGSVNQSIAAMTAGTVIINGTGGGITLAGDMTVTGTLTLTNGNITLGARSITLNGSVAGNIVSHIITNGTGAVISNNITTATVIPVAPAATSYNPVTISNGQGRNYTVRVAAGINPGIFNMSRAINRTWTITTNTPLASPADITLQYADADAGSSAVPTAIMEAAVHDGTKWNIVSPAAGLTPVGTATARQVTVQTMLTGPTVIANKDKGAFSYNGGNTIAVQLLPSLVNDRTKLRIITPVATKIDWAITDMTGRLIMKFNSDVPVGQTDIDLTLGRLAAGVYQIVGRTDKEKIPTVRFIVQH